MGNITVRPVQAADAVHLHRIQTQPNVMPYILSLPSARVEQFIERFSKVNPKQHDFAAELDGVVAGSGGLVQMNGRRSHCGLVYLAVDEQFHGRGVGTALLQKLLDLADQWLLLERVELEVLATNPRAQRLYERFGFVVEGRKRGGLVSQGQFVDEIVMARFRPGGRL